MRRVAVVLALLTAGCRSVPEPAPPERPLRDFRGVIHVHSRFSHDSRGTYEEILAACRKRRIDFVCMTDHPPKDDPGRPLREGWRGLKSGVLFIQGAEYGDQLLAVGLREPVAAGGRQAKIDAIHAQGALAFVCHPEEVEAWDFDGFDGMEIWNTHAALKELAKDPLALAATLKLAKDDLEGAWLRLLRRPEANLSRWDELNRRSPVVAIAGNDAHQNTTVMGVRLDPYDVSLGFVTTHVQAEDLSEQAVLRALREGRAYVAFEFVMPADDPPVRGPVGAHLGCRPADGVRYTVRRDGETVPPADRDEHIIRYRLDRPGRYRVEATRDGRPWIFTNPVRVP